MPAPAQSKKAHLNGASSSTVAFDSAVQAGDLVLVLQASYVDTNSYTITDPVATGYTFTPFGAEQQCPSPSGATSDAVKLKAFWAIAPSNGTPTITFGTSGATNVFTTVVIQAFTGPFAASPFDQSTSFDNTTADTHASSGTVDTTQAAELLIGVSTASTLASTITPTAGTGWTLSDSETDNSSFQPIAVEYRDVSSTGTYEADFTYDSAAKSASLIGTFKKAVTLLAGDLTGTGTISGTIRGSAAALAAAITGTGTGQGDLTLGTFIAAAISGTGTVAGALTTQVLLGGALQATALVSGKFAIELFGALTGTATVAATFAEPALFAAALIGKATLNGILAGTNVINPTPFLQPPPPAVLNTDLKQPFAQWHLVDVLFPSTPNTDVIVRHNLVPPTPEHVNYIVVRSADAATVYHDTSITRRPWQPGYIVLRSNVSQARVTLLVWVEHEQRTLPF